jgi:Flp pilus assembly protein TadG
MLRRFARDKRGNFSIMTVVAIIPILGGIALAIDYAELSRQRQLTLNALDAASVATAAHIVGGAISAADPAAYDLAIKTTHRTSSKPIWVRLSRQTHPSPSCCPTTMPAVERSNCRRS